MPQSQTAQETLSLTGKRWMVQRDLRPLLATRGDKAGTLLAFLAADRKLDLHGPFTVGLDAALFPDLPAALERVQRAVRDHEHIAIFGDYDCDGITSTALLLRAFHRRGIRPDFRLPHRMREGYGLKESHVREFQQKGIRLLLTVDTGIASAAEIEMATAAGMDVIVLDHHHLPAELPNALLLHPGAAGLPDPHPSAAGVAWSVVRAWEEKEETQWDERETDLVLACIGTIADLVELRGTNRSLIETGLRSIPLLPNGPLKSLFVQAGIEGPCSCRDIAFRVAPRINAAGRMEDPHIALQAILGDAEALAKLETLNQQRQDSVAALLEGTATDLPTDEMLFLCLASADITPGVAGLIAGKLTEKYGKPSLVASIQGDLCTASLRSIPGYHVTEALQSASDLLLSFGGHAQAAGCTFAAVNFTQLQERLRLHLEKTMPAHLLVPSLTIDTALDASMTTVALCHALQILEPFGQGNPEPRFLLENVRLTNARAVGRDGTHLQAMVHDKKVIGFGLAHLLESTIHPLDIVCRLGVDEWNRKISVQLFLEDARLA